MSLLNLEALGIFIKDLRKMAGITQKDLAEGVCTQAQISKLESGKEVPSSLTLYNISKKLHVDVSNLLDAGEFTYSEYVKNIKELIRKKIQERNYEEVNSLINKYKKNPLFKEVIDQQFLLWNEGVCINYLETNYIKALDTLKCALKMTRSKKNAVWDVVEIEILNSIAIIYSESKQYDEGIKCFNECLLHYQESKCKDVKVKIKILYGLSKTLTTLKQYDESIEYIDEGIKICSQVDILFLLGELYYQKGINLCYLGQKQLGIECLRKSRNIFEIQKNYMFLEFVDTNIEFLTS